MYEYAIFVQARLNSTRFPRKVLYPLLGKRVLDHVIDSCKSTGLKTFLLVPESDEKTFNELFDVDIHSGPEEDVLGRFIDCARQNDVRNIIRITSDCPCIPPDHITQLLYEHMKQGGFVTNVAYAPDTYDSLTNVPDGFDVEIFDRATLEMAHEKATEKNDREHVTSWMRRNCKVNIPQLSLAIKGKFSVDTKEDVLKLEQVFSLLKSLKTVRIR